MDKISNVSNKMASMSEGERTENIEKSSERGGSGV